MMFSERPPGAEFDAHKPDRPGTRLSALRGRSDVLEQALDSKETIAAA
jgi:hypothetical protein